MIKQDKNENINMKGRNKYQIFKKRLKTSKAETRKYTRNTSKQNKNKQVINKIEK